MPRTPNSSQDFRRFSPAAERNKQSILDVLKQVLPKRGTILEIASGSGQHAAFFAPRLQPLVWQPSDPNPQLRTSIQAWAETVPSGKLLPPLNLDVSRPDWPNTVRQSNRYQRAEAQKPERPDESDITAMVNINMIHISPWAACLGLLSGAQTLLPPGGVLYLYGPYFQAGKPTAQSNIDFDRGLRSQNPEWGIRDLTDVIEVAKTQKLHLSTVIEMPANNLSVVFVKQD